MAAHAYGHGSAFTRKGESGIRNWLTQQKQQYRHVHVQQGEPVQRSGEGPYLADTAGKSSIAISWARWGESYPRWECALNVQG